MMNNFLVRTISGAVFLALMVAGMLFHPVAFGVLFLVALYVSMREFLNVTMGQRWLVQQKLSLLTVCAAFILMMGWRFFGLDSKWFALLFLPVFALGLSVVLARSHESVEDVALAYAAILYIGLPFCLMPVMVSGSGEFNGLVLLNVFILIWCADVGSYSLGTLFGQKPTSRKLAPAISPKKSWWGFWGGIVMAMIGGLVLYLVGMMSYPLVHCVALGALVAVTGVCGDLFESVWKRRFGVKDSGNCIPGHGGMLDRFDSSLFAIPSVFVYLVLSGLL
ncbi:MAG: phosphatidate cytidylyltransferase [Bacteroidales bacterium]|nr:phosphatidate cytidylyltransferase [Bacteroidales bacterium]